MTIRLVDSGWRKELAEAVQAHGAELRIICPFIKLGALDRLLAHQPGRIEVITRFNLPDFAEGVSDITALRKLLRVRARVRGVRGLHAKLYMFGASRVILTSANLTEAALSNNLEFGMVSEDPAVVTDCRAYFQNLWSRAGADLSASQVDEWDEKVTEYRARGGRPADQGRLPDFGADAGMPKPAPITLPPVVSDAPQAFVKFLGQGSNREDASLPTIEEIDSAECHWALCYPLNKRPTGVRDGAVMFVSRLTKDPDDILIFGRAIGLAHEPGRDVATAGDIERRDWKATWPNYVRVSGAEFVAGPLSNGVSLSELMDTLGSDAFASTQRNHLRGEGNTIPRRAYRQQAHVELSNEGRAWLGQRLEAAFRQHGKVPQDELDRLYWPTMP